MKPISPALTKLIVVVMLPLVMCFGYYSLERFGEVSPGINILAVLALPMLLIGITGLTLKYAYRMLWFACIAISLSSLAWVWL